VSLSFYRSRSSRVRSHFQDDRLYLKEVVQRPNLGQQRPLCSTGHYKNGDRASVLASNQSLISHLRIAKAVSGVAEIDIATAFVISEYSFVILANSFVISANSFVISEYSFVISGVGEIAFEEAFAISAIA
jgi:hypothetical protein